MSRVFEHSIEADLENLKSVRSFIKESGQILGVDDDTLGDLCLVVDEAVTNIVLHGYDGQKGTVDLLVKSDGSDMVITLRDTAPYFDDSSVQTPHLDEPLAERKFGGMGVYLIRKLTDEFELRNLSKQGNELFLLKRGVVKN